MPRIKSLLVGVRVGAAKNAHNCKGNTRHRLVRGDTRLEISNGRNWHYYCLKCANTIVERDRGKLDELARSLRGETS